MINWETSDQVFMDTFSAEIPSKDGYCDDEIEGKVSVNIFDKIFDSLNNFTGDKYTWNVSSLLTCCENELGLIRTWSNEA
jgi:hypothetical protein